MANPKTAKQASGSNENRESSGNGIAKRFVGPMGAAISMAGLALFAGVILYSLVAIWPPKAASLNEADKETQKGKNQAQPSESQKGSSFTWLGWRFEMAFGPRLLLIVMLAGALGGLAHSLRSICWYVGNRDLVWSWVGAYFLQPFIAASLAILFYLVIRGGFVPSGSNLTSTNVFGFAAMGGLVGMFTNQAMVKLRRVAETLFEAAEQGEDHQDPRNKWNGGAPHEAARPEKKGKR